MPFVRPLIRSGIRIAAAPASAPIPNRSCIWPLGTFSGRARITASFRTTLRRALARSLSRGVGVPSALVRKAVEAGHGRRTAPGQRPSAPRTPVITPALKGGVRVGAPHSEGRPRAFARAAFIAATRATPLAAGKHRANGGRSAQALTRLIVPGPHREPRKGPRRGLGEAGPVTTKVRSPMVSGPKKATAKNGPVITAPLVHGGRFTLEPTPSLLIKEAAAHVLSEEGSEVLVVSMLKEERATVKAAGAAAAAGAISCAVY